MHSHQTAIDGLIERAPFHVDQFEIKIRTELGLTTEKPNSVSFAITIFGPHTTSAFWYHFGVSFCR